MLIKTVKSFDGVNLKKVNNKVNSWITDNFKNGKIIEVLDIKHEMIPPNNACSMYSHVFTIIYTKEVEK